MGEKREEHLVPAFCNPFQYPIFWLILPGWTLDGLNGLIKLLVTCTVKPHQKRGTVESLWVTVCFPGSLDFINCLKYFIHLNNCS